MLNIKTKQSALTLFNRKHTSTSEKIVATTAYDYTVAKLLEPYVDILLVGDSLGMVIQGNSNTLSVTTEDIIYHCRAVSKAVKTAHLVADMPFMSYQRSKKLALKNAAKIISKANAEALKLEGGKEIAPVVEKIVKTGIPVMGHLGLTPQHIHAMGGFKVQGKTLASRTQILESVKALEQAGIYALVLEAIPWQLAQEITAATAVPTIGIGAGKFCDGQVLVSQDLLGLNQDFKPKFVKRFVEAGTHIQTGIHEFVQEVRSGVFPSEEHSF